MGKKSSPAPDYTPLAQASEESARIMGALGQRQLDFAEQQYNEAKPFHERIAQQQIDLADLAKLQGDDYYNYLLGFRPLELSMRDEAMIDRSAELAAYDAANRMDANTMTMSQDQLYNLRRSEIEPMVAQAIADSQGAYTRNLNQAIRQGLRYGAATPNMVGQVGTIGLSQAQMQAAAANAARLGGIQDVRERAGLGLQTRQSVMDALNKERAIDWARKLDAAGLAKGMPGASAGAYGLAISSGTSAGQNKVTPGQIMQTGLSAGANTIGQGRQLLQSGLGNILNAQSNIYAADANKADPFGTIVGLGLGGWASGGFKISDPRSKENVTFVRVDPKTGLNLYAFNYIGDDTRYIGVMADEVQEVYPWAVSIVGDGFLMVDYDKLGIMMERVN